MRWKDKSNMTDTTVAGSDVLPITDVSTDQDRKITISIIATWVVTKFTTSVAGASQTIVAAINAVRQLAQDGVSAAAAAQDGVGANAAAIQQANRNIATNAQGIADNASDIATLNQTMQTTNDHVDELGDQVSTMGEQVTAAVEQAQAASEDAIGAADAASEAAETVQRIIDQGGMVLSVYGRSGTVVAETGDYDSTQITHEDGTVADALTYDAIPVSGSNKAVKSGGLYTQLSGKVSKVGDTMSGILRFQKSGIAIDHQVTNITYNVAPSARTYAQPVQVLDSTGEAIGHLEFYQNTDKSIAVTLGVRNYINNAWAWKNIMSGTVAQDGEMTYVFGNPAAARAGLGLGFGATYDYQANSHITGTGSSWTQFYESNNTYTMPAGVYLIGISAVLTTNKNTSKFRLLCGTQVLAGVTTNAQDNLRTTTVHRVTLTSAVTGKFRMEAAGQDASTTWTIKAYNQIWFFVQQVS